MGVIGAAGQTAARLMRSDFITLCWKPTEDERPSEQHAWYPLTSETQTWDSTRNFYEDQEAIMMEYHDNVVPTGHPTMRGQSLVIDEFTSLTADTADMTNNDNFHLVLQSCALISSVETTSENMFIKM